MATPKKKVVKKPAKAKKPAKKKAAPKKKKTPAKKKAVKSIPNPHIGKRYFKIEIGGYGGELIVGKASEEFVKYWLDEDRKSGLEDHIYAMHEKAMMGEDFFDEVEDDEVTDDIEGFDKDSPPVLPGLAPHIEYWNLDEFEHGTFVSSDYNNFAVSEIQLNPMAIYENTEITWDDKYCKKRNFDWSQTMYTDVPNTEKEITVNRTVYSRELFMEDDVKVPEKPVPAIMCYDAQKGVFGHLYVMTNGEDFDPKKLAIGVCENSMSNSIVEFFYDKQALSLDTNWLSTSGKGFNAYVGYLHHWDVEYDYKAMLEEGWAELEA